ncbi:MAG TPA: CTP synthase [Candidatus Didemnitutus sp.]|nr:CTP synthase [Candidatus Didemnitutus sp.]
MARLALIGDHNPDVIAHRAIPLALEWAARAAQVSLSWDWIGTEKVTDVGVLAPYDAVWTVPASPYRSTEGALHAIQWARETNRPFLGTCGGFQHAVIEFARHVAHLNNAGHAETDSADHDLVVTALSCALREKTGQIHFVPGSKLHQIFDGRPTEEGFHCGYGVNPVFRTRLEAAGMRFTGFDPIGDIRAMELSTHPFFIGTLFQPERSALKGLVHPLITAFARAIGGVPRPA